MSHYPAWANTADDAQYIDDTIADQQQADREHAADVPTDTSAPLDWVAQLPDPWRTVACGVCVRLVAAVDLTRHVTDCASAEVA